MSPPATSSSGPSAGKEGSDVEFRLTEHMVGEVPVLRLSGEVDLAAAPRVRARLTALAQGHTTDPGHPAGTPGAPAGATIGSYLGPVVVDLEAVTFIDSTGLSMLVAAHARFEEVNRQLRVAAIPTRVSRVLELTGLDGLLHTYKDVPSAVRGSDPGSS